jgi:hypothetical protein
MKQGYGIAEEPAGRWLQRSCAGPGATVVGRLLQYNRHQLDAHLVEQPGLQALPGHLPAVDSDVLVPGQVFRLRDRCLDAVGDEDEVFVVLRTVVGAPVGEDNPAQSHCGVSRG